MLPDGHLLLEVHRFETVRDTGEQPAAWYSSEKGLFSDEPHLVLQENFWNAAEKAAIERYFVIDAASGGVVYHSSSMQAFTNDDYRGLLAECGFAGAVFYRSLAGSLDGPRLI